jgi:hypothetical protein
MNSWLYAQNLLKAAGPRYRETWLSPHRQGNLDVFEYIVTATDISLVSLRRRAPGQVVVGGCARSRSAFSGGAAATKGSAAWQSQLPLRMMPGGSRVRLLPERSRSRTSDLGGADGLVDWLP